MMNVAIVRHRPDDLESIRSFLNYTLFVRHRPDDLETKGVRIRSGAIRSSSPR